MIQRVPLTTAWLACLLLAPPGAAPQSPEASLELLLKVLPPSNPKITGRVTAHDRTWEDWVRRTGERPPDWSKFQANPFLPDPLAGVTRETWAARRQWIRSQFEQWFFGKMPAAPANLRAVVTSERQEGGIKVRDVRLEFGPNHRATLRVQLLIPPGKGPFPVFLTNHPRTRPWAATAVRRGYIGAIYFAADPIYGNPDDSDAWIDIYPEADWSCLARWAWAAMRTVDHLVTLPEVDRRQIAITGHSRNGKQALLAAAFDERISAVSLSSGNTGEGNPWRYTTDAFANESIEQITGNFPHWFHPRLRFFVGREHLLPVDQNSLMALVAPRGLLLASAYAEAQGSPFGFEQAYRDARRVYGILNAPPERVGLSLRAGEHATTAEDIEQYVDFFDSVFDRGPRFHPETFVLGFDFADWKRRAGDVPAAPPATAALPERVRWALGDEPAGVPFPNRTRLEEPVRTSEGWIAELYNRPLQFPGAKHTGVSFGDDLKADLYYPAAAAADKPAPVVIWLHGYSYATGYSRAGREPIRALLERGFAVLAFDQIGFGTRLFQAGRFYQRYPRWSLLGKMVADTRAAIDALAALPLIDGKRIMLAGTSLGSRVALYTAAADSRVSALALLGGVAPLRMDRPELGAEGVRQVAQLHGLQPRLGLFAGREKELPVDDGDLLSGIAPRPVHLTAPRFDRYSPAENVKAMAAGAANVQLETPDDFHRFPKRTLEAALDWMAAQARK